MTNHGIEELKRQRDNAKSKHAQAQLDLAAAEKRLHDAMCRESGLMGKRVKSNKGVSILVHDVEFISSEPWSVKGFVFKADGNIGFSERRAYVSSMVVEDPRT